MSKRKACGFTLIEVLVAIAIGATMAGLAYQSLSTASLSVERSSSVVEKIDEIDRFWQLLNGDLERAVTRQWIDVYSQRQPAFSAQFGDRLAQSELAISGEDSYLMRFIRGGWENPLERTRSDLQLVSYRLEPVEDSELKTLWRDYSADIDVVDTPTIKRRRILDGIEKLQLRFLPDDAKNLQEDSWITGWPANGAPTDTLPIAVEIELTIEGVGEITRIFSLATATKE